MLPTALLAGYNSLMRRSGEGEYPHAMREFAHHEEGRRIPEASLFQLPSTLDVPRQ